MRLDVVERVEAATEAWIGLNAYMARGCHDTASRIFRDDARRSDA
jgi:hypothetical protein